MKNNKSTLPQIPKMPSDCVAALSLNEEGAEHPYASIFYTMVKGDLYFFALEVLGAEAQENGDLVAVYRRYDGKTTTDPNQARPLAAGHRDSKDIMWIQRRAYAPFQSEDHVLTYATVLRAIYRMRPDEKDFEKVLDSQDRDG